MTYRQRLPLAVILGMAILEGCAATPNVRVVSDPTANFGQYRTFAFVDPLGTDRAGYQSILSQALVAATRRQLEARGLRLVSDNPQLIIDFSAAVTDKLRVSSVPATLTAPYGPYGIAGGYYGYRFGLYSTWPSYRDETTITPYKQGTLNIDVADAQRKQLVWEGVVTGSVTDRSLTNLDATVDRAVASAFGHFPITATMPR